MQAVLSTCVSVDYRNRPGVLRRVKIEVAKGEILGLVGQSGSGKTTFAMATLGLLDPGAATVTGEIIVAGTDICGRGERDLRRVRGRVISLIPQNPVAALNPSVRIGRQLQEAWAAHAANWSGQGCQTASQLLHACGLCADDKFLRRFPHQISVGQAQRILIAMALLHNPSVLIADEPTSALDLVTQREVLDLIPRISADRGMAAVFISHDLPVVASLCHRVAILHEGSIIDYGRTWDVLAAPRHPYTRSLISAVPKWHMFSAEALE
jgi:ABC-type glutathione transport system ATPase component